MNKYRRGWFGNSQGHSMAARGIRLYAKKSNHRDPMFYAMRVEKELPTQHVMDMAKRGLHFGDVKNMHPDADQEVLRKRMISAIDSREGNDTLSGLDSRGIDASADMADMNSQLKSRMLATLNDPQKTSFLAQLKVDRLQSRLRGT